MLRLVRLLVAAAVLAVSLALATFASSIGSADPAASSGDGVVVSARGGGEELGAAGTQIAPPAGEPDDGAILWWTVVGVTVATSVLIAWYGLTGSTPESAD